MRGILILCLALQALLPAAGEKLTYEVRYKLGALNTKVATATIPLAEDTWEGKEALRSNAAITVQPVFRLFLKADYNAVLYLSADASNPYFYVYPSDKSYSECRYAADSVYYHKVPKGQEPLDFNLPNDNWTMEVFAMLFKLRNVQMEVGEIKKLKLYISGDFRNATLTLIGRNTERFPGRTADFFIINSPEKGLMENGAGNIIKIWRDHNGARPLLGIEVPLGTGTMIANLTDE